MLCQDKIIGIFCLIDDIMQGIGHKEDIRHRVSDSEVLVTALVSVKQNIQQLATYIIYYD